MTLSKHHLAFFGLTAIFLAACQPNSTVHDNKGNNQDDFVGCYSVEKGTPAQIKITKKGGYFMQMKEPQGGWDAPEAFDVADIDKVWEAYSVNALGLNQSDIKSSLARPDGVMTISRLGAGTAANPALDSTHVINIFGATNTVYVVPCDEVGLDLAKDGKQFHQ